MMINKKYTVTKKNKGIVPVCEDERKRYVYVDCENCIECRKKRAREWQVRLNEEIKDDKSGKFVTLSVSEEALDEIEKEINKGITNVKNMYGTKAIKKDEGVEANMAATIMVRRFTERWRKEFGKTIKHWLITELGHKNTERVHLHGLLFTDESKEKIEEKWMYGNVWIGSYVNAKTINYMVKYVTKVDEKHPGYKSKILTSKGIGAGYLKRWDFEQNKYKKGETNETYRLQNGTKIALPQYIKNKRYTDEEKDKLWTEKLDSNIKWVNGNKMIVKTEEDEKIYRKALEHNRLRSAQLGYGNGERLKKDYTARKKALKYLDDKK